MTRMIDQADLARSLPSILDGIALKRDRVLIKRNGAPLAAIVSPEDLEALEMLERQRAEQFVVLDEIRAAFRDVPPNEIEREVAAAISEVRAEHAHSTDPS